MRVGIVVTMVVAAVLTSSPTNADCQGANAWTGCEIANSGDSVDISAGASKPGSGSPSTPSHSDGPPSPRAPEPEPEPEECGPMGCRPMYSVETIPDVTIEDLASFRPATPSLTGQPAGFAVAGMPANLVAAASVQSIPGTVLDWDVTVRFTPVAFEFVHGDGTSAVHPTGGATWERLGQPQFTPTETSHVYRHRGTYSVTVNVRYSAAVDFGTGSWRPVPGYVTARAGGYSVRVLEARTALVDRTCAEEPNGPGC